MAIALKRISSVYR